MFEGSVVSNFSAVLMGAVVAVPVIAESTVSPLGGKITANSGMEEIHVTAHRVDANVNEVAASIGVISHTEIEELQANTMSQLFRYEAGVEVDRSGSRHGDASLSIRGIGGNRVLMLNDGVRMPDGFGSAGSDQGRGSFDPHQIEQVEILKGPSSALYGSDALGGVVIIHTLNPERLIADQNGEKHVELSSSYDSSNERSRVGLISATKLESGYGLLQLDKQFYKEQEINSDFKVNPQDGDTTSVLAKWVMNTADNQHWEFIGDYWHDQRDNDLQTNLGPISGPPGARISSSTATDESSRWHLGVHHTVESVLGFDQFHWQLDYQKSRYQQDEFETTISTRSNSKDVEHETFDQSQWSAGVQFQKDWNGHQWVLGLDALEKKLQRPVDRMVLNLNDGSRSETINGISYPGKTFPDTDIRQYGLFIQDKLQLSNALKLTLGVRYDAFQSRPSIDQAYDNFNPSGSIPKNNSASRWSPHLGLVHHLGENTQWYASYTTGFRAPPVDDQFISRAILIPVPGVPHEVVPNNNLTSETSKGYELGVRWQGEWARLALAYYNNSYQDFIDSRTIGYRDQPPIFTGARSIRQIQYQNIDSVKIHGWELNSTLILDSLMPSGWQGQLKVSVHSIDGKNQQSGEGLNSVGPGKAVLGVKVNKRNFGGGWTLSSVAKADEAETLFYRGRSLTAFEPPAYNTHDVNFYWKPNDRFRVNLSVFNLSDKKYWGAHAKGGDVNGNLDAKVALGRSYALNFRYQI